MKQICFRLTKYKCNKQDQNCLGCRYYNFYSQGYQDGKKAEDKFIAVIQVDDDKTWIEANTLKELKQQIKEHELKDFVVAIYSVKSLPRTKELL